MTNNTYRLTDRDLRLIAERIAESEFPPYERSILSRPVAPYVPMSAQSIYEMIAGAIEDLSDSRDRPAARDGSADNKLRVGMEG